MRVYWIYFAALLILVLVISGGSFEDELREQLLYCEMVGDGTWGDYNGNYESICKNEYTTGESRRVSSP